MLGVQIVQIELNQFASVLGFVWPEEGLDSNWRKFIAVSSDYPKR